MPKIMTKEKIKQELIDELDIRYSDTVQNASNYELYMALSGVVRRGYSDYWRQTREKEASHKQAYYFSIEFLPGRLLKSNLLNLGWLENTQAALADLGLDLDDIARMEPDMALGNGGLGRLAACFMDSLASDGYIGNGNSILYRYGMFRQKFVDGNQVELPRDWHPYQNPWIVRRQSDAVTVRFGGQVSMKDDNGWLTPVYTNDQIIEAVPYDVAMVGYHNSVANTLRLWDVDIPADHEIDYPTIADQIQIKNLTNVLYPNDSTQEGRITRIKQEYFFVSAGLQSIIHKYIRQHGGDDWDALPARIAVHINDTHPAMAIPELMRLLIDEHRVDWDTAWHITVQVMSYTNHTIMAEALEKWELSLLQQIVPRITQIIAEIDRRFVESLTGRVDQEVIEQTRIIHNGQVHMAHLAIIGSHSINGVAELHTQLLKTKVLKNFYDLYPERFNNKTNGITLRRWLQLANPALSKLIDQTIGQDWRANPDELLKLNDHLNDQQLLKQLNDVKLTNKKRLAQYIQDETGVRVDPTAIFDVQIKRLHAYKRQTLKLLHILKLYQDLKNGIDHPKRVVIFAAKAAPSYVYAKEVIKVINKVADMINNDSTIKDRLKVVFIPDYGVSKAENIIPAADISEQISTTTKEASGTSNMKLMANGALTVATLDGANIEIADEVGANNIFTFGLTKNEVIQLNNDHSYDPSALYNENAVIKSILDMLGNGRVPGCERESRDLYDSFLQHGEPFYVVKDLLPYLNIQDEVEAAWQNKAQWARRSLINIAHSARFSADKTVERYAQDIWGLTPVNG